MARNRLDPSQAADTLWLGYDGLNVELAAISALLAYQPAWDRRIAHSYGSVPAGIGAVVLLRDGRVLPARRSLEDLRARWTTALGANTDSPTAGDDAPPTQTADETTR